MNNLKFLRKKRKLTRQKLAEKVKISLTAIKKYECGDLDLIKARFTTILGLCTVLKCSPRELFGGEFGEKLRNCRLRERK